MRTIFRPPFLVPSSLEVTSAIINSVVRSQKTVPDDAAASFPASNDQYSEPPVWRFVSATSSVTTPVNFDTRQSLLGFLRITVALEGNTRTNAYLIIVVKACVEPTTLSRSSASGSDGTTSRDDRRG